MSGVVTAVMAATVLASGTATRFDPGVMDTVVANRILYNQLDETLAHKGYVALLDCAHLGRQVWLEREGHVDGPYLVADCAALQDRARLRYLGFAVDLSWELAREWGVVNGPLPGFTVYDSDPRLEEGEKTWR